MTNSNRKGKRGELELAHRLENLLGVEARRGQQYSGSPGSPDIVHSIPRVHIECKRVEKLNINRAMDQACADAGEDDTPVVMHRTNQQPWLCTVQLDDLVALATSIFLTKQSNN